VGYTTAWGCHIFDFFSRKCLHAPVVELQGCRIIKQRVARMQDHQARVGWRAGGHALASRGGTGKQRSSFSFIKEGWHPQAASTTEDLKNSLCVLDWERALGRLRLPAQVAGVWATRARHALGLRGAEPAECERPKQEPEGQAHKTNHGRHQGARSLRSLARRSSCREKLTHTACRLLLATSDKRCKGTGDQDRV
jgi:hypothetical protein